MSFPLIHAAARRTPARRAAMLAAVVALTGGVVHGGDCAATWTHTDVPTPQSQGLLYGIDAAADGTTWAVGRFSVQVGPFSYDDQPFATRWTGDAWETSTVPNPATLPVGQRDANFYDI